MSTETKGLVLTWLYLGGLFAIAFAQNRVISEGVALVAAAAWVVGVPLTYICYVSLRDRIRL
jgi:hypothetical protein